MKRTKSFQIKFLPIKFPNNLTLNLTLVKGDRVISPGLYSVLRS